MAFSPPPIRARATPGLKSASMQEVEVLKPGQQLGSVTRVRAAPRPVKYQLSGPGRRVS